MPGVFMRARRGNKALRLDPQYVYFPGTSGNYASTPDSAALSIVGDIDIRVKVALDDWTPASHQNLIAKWGVAGNKSWFFNLNTSGMLEFTWSANGTATVSKFATANTFADGSTKWVRVGLVVATGVATFYSSDDGVTWTTITTASAAGATSIFDSTEAVMVGARDPGGVGAPLAGKVYYAEIRNGINGTIVGVFVASTPSVSAVRTPASWTEPGITGTWTLNGTGWNHGIYPHHQITTPDSAALSIVGDIDLRVKLTMNSWGPGHGKLSLFNKQAGLAGYGFAITINNGLEFYWGDGSTVSYRSAALPAIGAGATKWLRVTHDVDNGAAGNTRTYYSSDDGVIWTQFGTETLAGITSIADGAAALEVGEGFAGGQALSGLIHYAEVRNGINGPVVAKFDASQVVSTGAQVPASINGWTVVGSAVQKYEDYIYFPGTSIQAIQYPVSILSGYVDDAEFIFKVALDDWTPAAVQSIFSSDGGDPQRRFRCSITTGGVLVFTKFTAGTLATQLTYTASVSLGGASVPVVDGGPPLLFKITYDNDNGSSVSAVEFFWSLNGVVWTKIGNTMTSVDMTPLTTNTAPLELGARNAGGSDRMTGKIHYASVANVIGGIPVVTFDARDIATPWTINGAGWNWEGSSFSGKPEMALDLSSVVSSFVSTPDASVLDITGDIELVAKVTPLAWVGASSQTVIAKRGAAGQRGYYLYLHNTGTLGLASSVDGTVQLFSSAAHGLTGTSTKWIKGARVAATGVVTLYLSDDGIKWTQLGAPQAGTSGNMFVNTATLTLGSYDGGGSAEHFNGTIHYAEVRNGINGPIVARFDPSAVAKTGTRLPATLVQPGGSPNLLTPNQASIETDATGWTPVNGSPTISQDATQFLDGTKSLKVVATATGGVSARVTPVTLFPVVVGKSYTVGLSVKANDVASEVNARASIYWYTAASAYIISSAGNNSVADDATWGARTVTAVAPATAAFGVLAFEIPAATNIGDAWYVDRGSIVETPTVWTMNGSAWDWVQVPSSALSALSGGGRQLAVV